MRRAILIACAVVLAGSGAPVSFGQGNAAQNGAAKLPEFEVATIRPGDPVNPKNGGTDSSADRFHCYGWTVKRIVETAYGIKDAQFVGGPKWIESDIYDIDAKVEDATAEGLKKLNYQQRLERFEPMMQALLAERFKLRVRRETRVLPVDVLLVGKSGAKLKPTPAPPAGTNLPLGLISNRVISGYLQVVGKNAPISMLASTLTLDAGEQDAIVVDETGLKGNYDFTLQWSPEEMMNGGASQGPLPGIAGAERLAPIHQHRGLRLDVQKRPVDVLVIDHIERPSEN